MCFLLCCFLAFPVFWARLDVGLRNGPHSTFDSPMRDIAIASAQFVHQHDNVRRPGESHRGAGRKKKTKKHLANRKPKTANKPKQKTKKPQGNQRNDNVIILVVWCTGNLCALYRAGHPFKPTRRQTRKHHRMSRQVPKQKSHNAETRDPLSRILEIGLRGCAGMTGTNAHRPR